MFNGASGAGPPAAAESVGFHGAVELSRVNEFKVFVNDGDFHLSEILLSNRRLMNPASSSSFLSNPSPLLCLNDFIYSFLLNELHLVFYVVSILFFLF